MLRLVKGAEMQNKKVLLPTVLWLRNDRDISAFVGVSHEEQWFSSPHQASQTRAPVMGREVSIASGYENQQVLQLS